MKSLLSSVFFTLLGVCMLVQPVQAKYPEKPVNMIVAFTAGGSSDVQARIMQKYWDKYVPDQPWIFVYKPGAGGAIGFTEISRAKKDGYTIGGMNIPHMILQPLAQGAQYNINDFDFIAQVVNDPQTITVHKDSPFQSVDDIFKAAKENPSKVTLGLVGPMSGHHLMAMKVEQEYPDVKFANIFYKGAADQNAALIGREIDFMYGNLNDVMRSLDEFRILGIASKTRNDFIPDVPTLEEVGYPIFSDIRRLYAVPKGLPPEALAFLRETFKKIMDDPDYIADMKKSGQPHEYLSGEELRVWLDAENAQIVKMMEESNLLKK